MSLDNRLYYNNLLPQDILQLDQAIDQYTLVLPEINKDNDAWIHVIWTLIAYYKYQFKRLRYILTILLPIYYQQTIDNDIIDSNKHLVHRLIFNNIYDINGHITQINNSMRSDSDIIEIADMLQYNSVYLTHYYYYLYKTPKSAIISNLRHKLDIKLLCRIELLNYVVQTSKITNLGYIIYVHNTINILRHMYNPLNFIMDLTSNILNKGFATQYDALIVFDKLQACINL